MTESNGKAKPRPKLTESQESTNVWVDHCEFSSDLTHDKDFHDGLVDSSHGSDFITISQ